MTSKLPSTISLLLKPVQPGGLISYLCTAPVSSLAPADEEAELKRWRRRRNTSNALHFRAGIVLDCAHQLSGEEIAERHNTG